MMRNFLFDWSSLSSARHRPCVTSRFMSDAASMSWSPALLYPHLRESSYTPPDVYAAHAAHLRMMEERGLLLSEAVATWEVSSREVLVRLFVMGSSWGATDIEVGAGVHQDVWGRGRHHRLAGSWVHLSGYLPEDVARIYDRHGKGYAWVVIPPRDFSSAAARKYLADRVAGREPLEAAVRADTTRILPGEWDS